MLPLTIFLGKLIGLYCIILALAMMRHKQSAVATMNALIRNPPLPLFVEILGLAAGLAMVLGHNIWSGGALPVVVTLVGWLMAIRGAALLALPQDAIIKLFEVLHYEKLFYVYMGATLILGLFMTYAASARDALCAQHRRLARTRSRRRAPCRACAPRFIRRASAAESVGGNTQPVSIIFLDQFPHELGCGRAVRCRVILKRSTK